MDTQVILSNLFMICSFAILIIGLFILLIVFRKKIKSLLAGKSKPFLRPAVKHIINCANPPFIPPGYSVEKHQPGNEQYEFDAVKVFLFQSKKQEKEILTGDELLQELDNIPVLNVNVLDYLLAHKELIPESWKDKRIYFLGTIYLLNGIRVVRYLYWSRSQWSWCQRWLESGFDYRHFAAAVPKN